MKQSIKPWLNLSIPLVILLVVATIAGVFFEGTYAKDSEYFAVQGIAQDFIMLVLVAPLMTVCIILGMRGSEKAVILWLGCLAYLLYSYIIYAFMVNFNQLFLVYCLILSLSLFCFIGGLSSLQQNPTWALPKKTRRTLTTLFLITAILFYFMWLSEIIPATLNNITPQSIIDNGTPTNAVHVLDLTIMLPGLIITAWMLRKEKSLGVLLSSTFIIFPLLLGLTIIAMVIYMAMMGFAIEWAMVIIFGIVTGINLLMMLRYLKNLQFSPSN